MNSRTDSLGADAGASIAEVCVVQGQVVDRALEQGDRFLQLIAFGAAHPNRIALDRGLHFDLAVFDKPNNALCVVARDTFADAQDLLDFVAADLLNLASAEKTYIKLPFGALRPQYIAHLRKLEVVIGKEREFHLLVLDARIRSLEIKARANLPVGMVQHILHLDQISFADYIEGGHACYSKVKLSSGPEGPQGTGRMRRVGPQCVGLRGVATRGVAPRGNAPRRVAPCCVGSRRVAPRGVAPDCAARLVMFRAAGRVEDRGI